MPRHPHQENPPWHAPPQGHGRPQGACPEHQGGGPASANRRHRGHGPCFRGAAAAGLRDILNWKTIPARVVNVTSIVAGEYAENEVRKNFTIRTAGHRQDP